MSTKNQATPGDEAVKAPPAPPKSPRRRAREFALQGLYQRRVGGHDEAAIEAHLRDSPGFDKADSAFFCHPPLDAVHEHVDKGGGRTREFTRIAHAEDTVIVNGPRHDIVIHGGGSGTFVDNDTIRC